MLANQQTYWSALPYLLTAALLAAAPVCAAGVVSGDTLSNAVD